VKLCPNAAESLSEYLYNKWVLYVQFSPWCPRVKATLHIYTVRGCAGVSRRHCQHARIWVCESVLEKVLENRYREQANDVAQDSLCIGICHNGRW
jgi:hypothetical protein